MSDINPNETLIATFEKSLRQTRNAQQRLLVRLREVESEADRLRQDIEALDTHAQQTEAAIYGLLETMRSDKRPRHIPTLKVDDDYELPPDLRKFQEREASKSERYKSDSNLLDGYERASERGGSSGSPRGGRSVPAISDHIEPVSQRFADRTITQACTLILRESGEPLHVNELYNLLVAGGFEFKGNNPTISIAVSLNRNRRFRKVAPGTFDLVIREASKAS
ncbi:MAG: hypothetical protein DWQ47_03905 [Acidobacteria bacterium]|nr:MAG: hypothetical protein DWQ32_07455 [Acidobacteriota bacterium]REK01539.1 MAG: hypothetical protein DWQ38_03890 [Acidobacteriota bacterium]REK14495.1 MAG: hypothetical protein DWQ43_13145 [Acidobacteriota bacterium]REK45210.1 MAG: hypothetical protein DWQ47_03905 [Acidobacteriota bacterium]